MKNLNSGKGKYEPSINIAEAELHESREVLSLAMQSSRMGAWSRNLATEEVYWSGELEEIFGLAAGTFAGTINGFYDYVYAADRDLLAGEVRQAIAEKRKYVIEFRFHHADGSLRWMEGRGQGTYAPDGSPVKVYGIGIDITERKQSEVKLRESEENFRALVAATAQSVWTAKTTGQDENAQKWWRDITGQPFEESAGWGWLAALHPEDREKTRTAWENSLANATTYDVEYRIRRKNDEYLYVSVCGVPIFNPDGSFRTWIGTLTDITERKKAEEQLRESENNLQTLANSIPQLAWMAEPDGFIFWYNRRWYDYTGTSIEEMAGWGWEKVHDAGMLPEVTRRWKDSIANGKSFEMEFPLRGANGEFRWFLTLVQPLRDTAGNITRWFGTNTDIDDLKRIEAEREKLLQSEQTARRQAEQANRLKDEFLATVSHELRTPLNAILGWTTVAKTSAGEPESVSRALDIIERNGRSQNQLISDILDVSRIITGKLNFEVQAVELVGIVQATIESLRPALEAKEIELTTAYQSKVQLVIGDANRLQQIVWNLLSNAVKFTPKGGKIAIKIQRGADFAEISVSDTGEGIEPEFLPFVFDRFRQAEGGSNRRHGGLGLGLAIVRHLTEMHGGTVEANSAGKQQGATFTVKLPVDAALNANYEKPSPTLRQNPVPEKPARRFANLRVLVVDDEADARELVNLILGEMGAEVVSVGSTAEALAQIERAKFDILISDIGMPCRDGYNLIGEIRQRKAENGGAIPALAFTAYAGREDRQRALDAGFQQHLPKPVEPDKLISAVAELARLEALP